MSGQAESSNIADQLVGLSTTLCTELTNYLIGRGYFLRLDHIGLILRECYSAALCIMSIRDGAFSSRDQTSALIAATSGPIREWLMGVYAASRRDFDYESLAADIADGLEAHYARWCEQVTGGEDIGPGHAGRWIPAATSACIRNITSTLEEELDINLSYELAELNTLIYRRIAPEQAQA